MDDANFFNSLLSFIFLPWLWPISNCLQKLLLQSINWYTQKMTKLINMSNNPRWNYLIFDTPSSSLFSDCSTTETFIAKGVQMRGLEINPPIIYTIETPLEHIGWCSNYNHSSNNTPYANRTQIIGQGPLYLLLLYQIPTQILPNFSSDVSWLNLLSRSILAKALQY